ncbi:MAG: WYL domain-containing protein [Coriobacteriia bacterium]|nr:WYL domain-containing protein [Coriobacteriia bacterium]
MSGNANGKLRVLYIMQMLQEETDEEHGLSMTTLIKRLRAKGLPVDRKTVYTDFATLREFGFVINTYQRNPVEYALANRDFSLDELTLLVDAVGSCRFITQTQVDRLQRKLRDLASESQREKLTGRIHVDGRVRGRGDRTLKNVDIIHEAMRVGEKVSFTYWKLGSDGKWHPQGEGKTYVVTPVHITFSDTFYYLTAWSDADQQIREYRLDRMRDVRANGQPAVSRKEIAEHVDTACDTQYFNRFDGELVTLTLKVDEDLVGAVWDRFGADADIAPAKKGATARVKVRVSSQFFGWLAGLGGKVTVQSPKRVATQYTDYLRSLLGE